MNTTIIGASDERDPRVAGLRQYIADREAREAAFAAQLAPLREARQAQRQTEAAALAAAREAAQNRPASASARVSADIREAAGTTDETSPRQRLRASMRANAADLLAVTRHRGQMQDIETAHAAAESAGARVEAVRAAELAALRAHATAAQREVDAWKRLAP